MTTQDEPAVVKAARDIQGVSATSGDTALEPLLNAPAARQPTWVYASGIGLLAFLLFLQLMHYNRHGLVLNSSVGPLVSTVYGWFDATLTPRWDLSAYSVKQLGAEAEGSEGSRLRVRLSVQNDSDRVQPLPLLRLTLQDRYGNAVATRDLEPREYLPPRAAGQRLLEPDQRIDAELHVIDPGKAAIGFEIDACLRSDRRRDRLCQRGTATRGRLSGNIPRAYRALRAQLAYGARADGGRDRPAVPPVGARIWRRTRRVGNDHQ